MYSPIAVLGDPGDLPWTNTSFFLLLFFFFCHLLKLILIPPILLFPQPITPNEDKTSEMIQIQIYDILFPVQQQSCMRYMYMWRESIQGEGDIHP
jgi:hypothetical protein